MNDLISCFFFPFSLEWIVCKLSRSIQAPDCVMYGLCLAISPAMLAQASQSASSFMAGGTIATGPGIGSTTTGPQTLQGGTRNLTGPTNRPGASGITHQPCSSSMAADTTSTNVGMSDMSGTVGTTIPAGSGIPGYPFLMTDNLELNRFILFSLLQIYYVYGEHKTLLEILSLVLSWPITMVIMKVSIRFIQEYRSDHVICFVAISNPLLLMGQNTKVFPKHLSQVKRWCILT